jgi:hypothetical protein
VHADAERAKNAPSQEVGGVFCPHHGRKPIGALEGEWGWGVLDLLFLIDVPPEPTLPPK